jgi:hypothetical protein
VRIVAIPLQYVEAFEEALFVPEYAVERIREAEKGLWPLASGLQTFGRSKPSSCAERSVCPQIKPGGHEIEGVQRVKYFRDYE